ncbi:MAG: c-type cytochrome [Chitinophagales bacterium]|nr:c-type cytochrome [Chitinophagales bacterium]
MYNNVKKISVSLLLGIASMTMFAQGAASEVAEPGLWESISIIDKMLLLIAIVLLIPIFYFSRIFNWSLKHYLNNKLNNKLNSAIWVVLLSLPAILSAQNNTATPSYFDGFNFLRWFLILVIILEAFVLAFFGKLLFNQFELFEGKGEEKLEAKSWFVEWWNKMNNFGTREEEERIDTGHNYDGIRELDNNIPAWFTAAFVACVLFAVVYMYLYHIESSLPLSAEEYTQEVEAAELAHQQYLKTAGSSVDENNLVLTMDKADIAEGAKLFAANCAACHLADGGGLQGPNLTDDNWVLGCADKDIYKTIKYGGTKGKGMQAWGSIFNDKQITQLASFVKSLHGTKPATPKAAEGSPCSMAAAATNAAPADSTVKDSTALATK